jgi:uncharacterized protein (TIGR02117 family)
MSRHWLRWLAPLLAVGVLALGLTLREAERRYAVRSAADARVVYLSSNGWHTGIVLPVSQIPPDRLPAKAYFPGATFLEIGWGEAGFYRAKEITFMLSLKALFASEASVMQVVGFSQPLGQFFPQNDNIEIELSTEGFDRLLTFVENAFSRGENGQPVFLGPGLYRNSYFFASDTRYHALRTCNAWVARALWESGLPLRPFLAIRSATLLDQVAPWGHQLR